MAYPSTVTTFSNPLPTDRLNSPSHSSIETAQNTGLTEVQTFLGTTTASAVGTLIYDIRSPSSNGGGHIQSANKGGTGQTSYLKADLLVGQSSSVLTKLAAGNDGQILSLNSSTATGLNWIDNGRPKVTANASLISFKAAGPEQSILTTTIPGSTLGTSNVLRSTLYVSDWNLRSSILVKGIYGGSPVASVLVVAAGTGTGVSGRIGFTVVANNSATSQRNFLEVDVGTQNFGIANVSGGNISSVVHAMGTDTSSIASSADQVFGVVVKVSTDVDSAVVNAAVVEKII